MKPRFSQNLNMLAQYSYLRRSFLNNFRLNHFAARASSSGRITGDGGTGDSKGNAFLLPGATMTTILMLGALHARRLYEDKKLEEKRERGIELEFHPDVKALFLGILPSRLISRAWGSLMSMEIPVRMLIKPGLELSIQILKKQLCLLKNMLLYRNSLFAA